MKMRKITAALGTTRVLVAILSTIPGIAVAQTSNGTVAGTVVDAKGAAVSRAIVSIAGAHTGVGRSTTTNTAGGYRFDSVLLDTYTVTAEAPSFSKRSITNVVVNASVITSVNPVLAPGAVTETVQVE